MNMSVKKKPICRMLKFKGKQRNCLCVKGSYLTPLFRWRPHFRGGFSFQVDHITEITGRKCIIGIHNTWSLIKLYNTVQKCHLKTRKELSPQPGGKSNEKSYIFSFIVLTSLYKMFTCCHLKISHNNFSLKFWHAWSALQNNHTWKGIFRLNVNSWLA